MIFLQTYYNNFGDFLEIFVLHGSLAT